MTYTKHLSLAFFLFVTLCLKAQEYHFKPSAVFQNIPSLETYNVFQDSKGIIWVCSDAGLNRYDGNTMRSFTTKDGISENVVLKACEDRKGRVWFSTVSGLFFYYEKGKFYSIAANKVLKTYFGVCCPGRFFIGENDTLVCGPLNMTGFLKIPPENNYGKVILSRGITLSHQAIHSNKLNPSETTLCGGGKYSWKNKNELTVLWDRKIIELPLKIPISHATFGRVHLSDKTGNTLYVSTHAELDVIQKNSTHIEQFMFTNEIIDIFIDRDNDLWISTRKGGTFLFKGGNLRTKPLRFLDGISVSGIFVDREGTIWASTLEKGVFACYSKNIFAVPNKETKIGSVQIDSNSLNVSYFSKKTATFFKNDSMFTDTVPINFTFNHYLLSYYRANEYCYAGTSSGLLFFKKEKGRILLPPSETPAITKEIVKYRGDTLIALSSWSINTVYKGQLLSSARLPYVISCFVKLQDGTSLIASRNGKGIFQYKNNKLLPYLTQLPQLLVRINFIVEDKNKRLWIATNENGLYCYNEHQQLIHFNQKGLSSKINYLAVDDENNIWCAQNDGLVKFLNTGNFTHPSIINFNQSNGLPDVRIEKLGFFNGKIWCFTKDYLFYFQSNALKPNAQPPLTGIRSIFLNGKEVAFTDTLTTTYDQNNIKIEPTVSSYKSTEKRDFIYKLQGYDNEWHYLNKENIQYTNLDHGTYKLVIYGLNNDGLKSTAPATFTLIINRPFWYTWWFVTLVGIVFLASVYFTARYWKRKIEKKERDKASINQQLAEFKMTALRSQMNPHFIYNAIGSIQHYILKNEIDQSFNYLSKFSSLIRKILNNSRNEYISLEQEISTLQLYIELEQIRFKYPFKFALHIDEALDMEMDIPTMLIQPYIENSIWHGLMPKESQGQLELTLKKVDASIHVTIRDNGIGRESEDLSKKYHISKGMSLTQQRIQTLEHTSKKKFDVRIVDLKDEKGNSLGTEVNLVIPIDE